MTDRAFEAFDYIECRMSGHWQPASGPVICEQPVGLTVNGKVWLTLVSSPFDLEALAVGFLYNEGVFASVEEVADIRTCPTLDNVDVWLTHAAEPPARWLRTSGCMGGMTVEKPEQANHIPQRDEKFEPSQLVDLFRRFSASADLHHQAGGLHASALSDGQQILALAEDIGRHNTLDKIAGKLLLDRIEAQQRLILTSGRISSEMIQKSARLRAEMVISRTAPTSTAVNLARAWGITLIGYARGDRFTIYSHPGRVLLNAQEQSGG